MTSLGRLVSGLLLLFTWQAVEPQSAGVLYIRASATGANTGLSWQDAHTSIPDQLARGATYYVAGGDYSALIVETAEVGTVPIEIKRATDADHGSDLGWDPSFAYIPSSVEAATYSTRYVSTSGVMIRGDLVITPGAHRSPSMAGFLDFYDVQARSLFVLGEDIRFFRGSFGGFDACEPGPDDIVKVWDNGDRASVNTPTASSRVLFDGVLVHDTTDRGNGCAGTAKAGVHSDCLQILGGHEITIRNSLFYNCPTSAIIAAPFRDTLDGLVIENNWFQSVQHPGTTLNLGGGEIVVRYNTILGGSSFARGGGRVVVKGNILSVGGACGDADYDYNLFTQGAVCGTHASVGISAFVSSPSPRFMNGLVPNYRFGGPRDPAIDRGDPSSFPATDILGTARYVGAAPDLGAFEYVSLVPSPPTNVRITR